MKIMCQLCDYLFLLISYVKSISIYKLLVDTLSLMCLACCVAERLVVFFWTLQYTYVEMKLFVNIYRKVIWNFL